LRSTIASTSPWVAPAESARTSTGCTTASGSLPCGWRKCHPASSRHQYSLTS
jgi:hypothetical protein